MFCAIELEVPAKQAKTANASQMRFAPRLLNIIFPRSYKITDNPCGYT
jgi:hypothetical protein